MGHVVDANLQFALRPTELRGRNRSTAERPRERAAVHVFHPGGCSSPRWPLWRNPPWWHWWGKGPEGRRTERRRVGRTRTRAADVTERDDVNYKVTTNDSLLCPFTSLTSQCDKQVYRLHDNCCLERHKSTSSNLGRNPGKGC